MKKLLIIAGNCVLEDLETSKKTARFLKKASEKNNFKLIYKSSFKKDNRSSYKHYIGPGIKKSMEIFKYLKKKLGLKIATDFHNPQEVATEIAKTVDVFQLPAYLSMQTELTLALAKTGKPINIKKGQFLHPEDVGKVIKKIESVGNKKIMVTERGTCFGYRNLVVDPRSFQILKSFGYPVIFDAGHSVRKYGIPSRDIAKGGEKEFIATLAKAAIGSGADGIFIEVHPEPRKALCDAATQLDFKEFKKFIKEISPVWKALH
jgi:2-dehydro-3-deoxyphosphooctonate aldolase (KDO 8-P synthase)